MKTKFTPRPGHPGTTMLTEFVCPAGHTVIEFNSREKAYLSKTPDPYEPDTVACEECGIDYRMAVTRTMVPVEDDDD